MIDSVPQTNQLDRVSNEGEEMSEENFHDASDFIQPDEDTSQRRKVSQRELASLGSVNAQGLLESEIFSSRRSRLSLPALKAKYENYLQDVLEKELYVPNERHDPILPMKETDIKKSFQAYKTMVDAWTDVGHELVLLLSLIHI